MTLLIVRIFLLIVKHDVRHVTPGGDRGKAETPQHSEEAQISFRRKRVSVAQWNELVINLTTLEEASFFL